MMLLSLLAGLGSYTLASNTHYAASVVMSTITFIFWFAAVNAPDNEKYRGH
jgi:4-amino-4-deoxy-L-arabinose transferase-like glycosyltransferase